MSNKQDHTPKSAPVSNYGAAVARALEWLGDRYLLAKPINAHNGLRSARRSGTAARQLVS
jgi:hypothetical protein